MLKMLPLLFGLLNWWGPVVQGIKQSLAWGNALGGAQICILGNNKQFHSISCKVLNNLDVDYIALAQILAEL